MIKILQDLEQGSPEWLAARCGLLTASEMKLIITPTLKISVNEKATTHLYELVAQRITKYVEPSYIGDDMLRGINDEVEAKIIYNEKVAKVTEVGFITNDKWGFAIGYSPDGLIGDDGLIEIKSRKQKFQVQSIILDEVPSEHIIQCQTGLLVSERKWIDYVQYCGGMPLYIHKVYPDLVIQDAIIEAASVFEKKAVDMIGTYTALKGKYIMTERIISDGEIVV